jgi:hypothetical protein
VQIEASIEHGRLDDLIPGGVRQGVGSIIPSPDGTTVRYEGMDEFRSADIPPIVQFVMDVGANVSAAGVIAIGAWIIKSFRPHTSRITINRREIDLDDEGHIRRIIEEEIEAKGR